MLESLVDNGALFENYVVSELYKSFSNVGLNPPLYYYRDANNRKEIDIIIERSGMIFPVEIKESSNPEKKAIKNFNALLPLTGKNVKVGTGSVICNAADLYPIGDNVWAVPNWYI
jgi:predicted AAA+ superfamily ATPase